jgi:glycosidase
MIRTPMQWSAGQHAGFTTGSPWESVNSDYLEVNVESEAADAGSLLNLYRGLIQLRQANPVLQSGDFRSLNTGSNRIYAGVREYQGKSLLILMNMGDKPVSDYGINLKFTQPAGSYTFKLLMGESALAPVTLDADGVMEGYKPVDELPANTRLILELVPNQ